MVPNPYEAPRLPSGRPSKFPLLAAFAVSCLTWAFFGGLMYAQYHDEAAGYVPLRHERLGLSLVFLRRSVVEQ